MLEKDLKYLLTITRGNGEVIDDFISEGVFSFEIANEMISVYNYVVESFEKDNFVLPPNIKKVALESNEKDYVNVFQNLKYKNKLLAKILEIEINKNVNSDNIFDNLENYELNEKKHVREKISMLEDEIEDAIDEIKHLEIELEELETNLELIIVDARNKNCDDSEAFKVTANVNLDIQKENLKIEKIRREIDKRNEFISRKKNEAEILRFKLLK